MAIETHIPRDDDDDAPAAAAADHEPTTEELLKEYEAAEAGLAEPAKPAPAAVAPAAPARGEDGKFAPAKPAPAPAATDEEPEIPKVEAALRARVEAQKTREAAKSEADRHLEEAKAEAERIRAEARAEAKRVVEEEQRAFRDRYAKAPLEAIKGYGIDTKRLVDDVTREGTPEWQEQKRREAWEAEQTAKASKLDAFLASQTKREEEAQTRYAAENRRAVVAEFVDMVKTQAPEVREFYQVAADRLGVDVDDLIVAQGDKLHKEYGQATGSVAQLGELVQTLKYRTAERQRADRQEHGAHGTGSSARQLRAAGSRSLTASGASERRASPKPFVDLSPEEQRADLEAVYAEAMRTAR